MQSLTPSAVTAGSAGFNLAVTGTNFTPQSVIRWNGVDRPTTFVSATLLRVPIPAPDLVQPTTVNITVFSPSAGPSNELPFTVSVPPPPGAPALPAPADTADRKSVV